MSEQVEIETLLRKVHSEGLPRYPLLVVFYTGGGAPPGCVSMPRIPMLPGGFVFGEDFGSRVRQAMTENESAHDGAVAFGRASKSDAYKCTGWSYRIVAAGVPDAAEVNRGAAYNSAISLSLSTGVDLVCLFSRELEIFVGGKRAIFVEGR